MWPSGLLGGGRLLGQYFAEILTGAANTKGSWVQVTASMSSQIGCDGFFIVVNPNTARSVLLDVGIGGAGSEQVILSNLGFGGPTGGVVGQHQVFIPLRIPPGTRVAIRAQAVAASQTIYTYTHFHPAGPFFSAVSAGKATTYGANTADSGGTEITPSATANTKGAYAQLSAAIESFRSILFCPLVEPSGQFDNSDFYTDLAVGAAASEQIMCADVFHRSTVQYDTHMPFCQWLPLEVAGGQRLAARAQSNVTTVDRIFDLIVIGFE